VATGVRKEGVGMATITVQEMRAIAAALEELDADAKRIGAAAEERGEYRTAIASVQSRASLLELRVRARQIAEPDPNANLSPAEHRARVKAIVAERTDDFREMIREVEQERKALCERRRG
jgi:hypothetical protein